MHADDIPALADAIYRSKVLRARRVPAESRIGESLNLYDECWRMIRSGLAGSPAALSPDAVESEVARRAKIAYRLSDHGCFRVQESTS